MCAISILACAVFPIYSLKSMVCLYACIKWSFQGCWIIKIYLTSYIEVPWIGMVNLIDGRRLSGTEF